MTASTVVFDTSVIVKWLRGNEPLSDEAYGWWQRFLGGEVECAEPHLLSYEVANALIYKGELSVREILDAVNSLYASGIDWFEPTLPLITRSIQLARLYDLSSYDATFVALAEALGAEFITADEKAFRRLTSLPYVKFLGN